MTQAPLTTQDRTSWHGELDGLQAAWKRLSVTHRCLVAMGPWVAAGLLLALAQTCEQAVQRGHQLRAEQRPLAGEAAANAPVHGPQWHSAAMPGL